MLTMSDKRPKVTFDVAERYRRALAIAAAERNCTVGDIISDFIDMHMGEYLERADKAIAAGVVPTPTRKGKPPKRPKP